MTTDAPTKPLTPAIDGWFEIGNQTAPPHLLGTQCRACATYFFPRETVRCRNPRCGAAELDEVPLSRRGTLWSYTNGCYKPPPPYVAEEPFEPYTIAAVTLDKEQMTVLGQVEGATVDDLRVGMPMELIVGRLFEDDESVHVVWKWRPAS